MRLHSFWIGCSIWCLCLCVCVCVFILLLLPLHSFFGIFPLPSSCMFCVRRWTQWTYYILRYSSTYMYIVYSLLNSVQSSYGIAFIYRKSTVGSFITFKYWWYVYMLQPPKNIGMFWPAWHVYGCLCVWMSKWMVEYVDYFWRARSTNLRKITK